MTYKIVAYGPEKECLTWADDKIELEIKKQSLTHDGYERFEITNEEENDRI